MNILAAQLAAHQGVTGTLLVAVGVVIVALLIAAVWWGLRRQDRAPRPPRPEEQPRRPRSGREARERREPADVPRDGPRLTPHQLPGFGNQGTRRARDQAEPPPRRDNGDGAGPSA
ncbi:DUF6479 family protein [Streptomyces sp. cg36]|uniref:DUF6479 family protein n=1 Tax=Streptomyces sp. cg36 TaxID=3238798 RepID=UPI0034E29E0A